MRVECRPRKRKSCNPKDQDSTQERNKQSSQIDGEGEPLGDSWAAGPENSQSRWEQRVRGFRNACLQGEGGWEVGTARDYLK